MQPRYISIGAQANGRAPGVPDGGPAGQRPRATLRRGTSWLPPRSVASPACGDQPVPLSGYDRGVTCRLYVLLVGYLSVPYLSARFPDRPGPGRSTGVKIRRGGGTTGGS